MAVNRFLFTIVVCLLFCRAHAADLVYAPEPVDNPLSGLVPYVFADGHENFPHSLEFQYFAFDQLMTGWSTFDWTAIEETLAKTSSRGNQLVLRIYLEYPGKPSAVPQFLRDAGVKVTKWNSSDGDCYTPDYENKSLRRAIEEFITALGKQYDNDPRMGFVTAGILGSWGEWHTYPRTDLWASKDVQSEVLSAYSAAFKKVPVLLRYPAGQNHPHQAANDSHEFGYHDDSFAWATLDTGRKDDSWFYMSILKQAGPKAVSKWQTSPIGGEIRPELWKNLFTDDQHPKQQDFAKCVSVTHASWLMESGLFKRHDPPSAQRVNRAKQQVRRLGYELQVRRANLDDGTLKLVVENRGVAPFYHDWPVEIRYSAPNLRTRPLFPPWKLSKVMPGQSVTWQVELGVTRDVSVRVRVANPMPRGKPLRFANQEMNGEWLELKF